MMKAAWISFTAPMRARPPIQDWSKDLLAPHEKAKIVEANQEITRQAKRLEQELSLIERDHRKV